MIVESSTSSPRDSKRSHNGFPAISNPDTPTKHDTLATAGPSNEPPPPTYEEAVSVIEASASSSTAGSASSSGFAPSQDKYAAQGGTTAFALSPYANPAVTGYYGAPAQTLRMPSGAPSPETSRGGRHVSGASCYAPSTSSGLSRASDSGLAPSPTLSSHSSLLHPEDGLAGASVARSSSSSASTAHTASSGASRPSHPAASPPSDRGHNGPAEGPLDSQSQSQSQSQASTSTRRAQSFARAPANGPPYAYGPFPPATLHARSDDLQAADGFPREPPTCACAPHPFVTHDVREEDWARFLDDVRRAGGLAPVSGFVAGAAPVAVRVGIIGGLIAGHALRAHIKSKRKSPVADVVDEWNRKFFHPRCMDVVLAQGVITYTGPANALPPDIAWRTKDSAAGKHVKAYEDTSDDDDERSARGIPGTAAVGSVGRRLHSMGRRVDTTIGGRGKRGRIALSQDLKASAGEAWRLVVSYNPPVL